MKKQVIQDIRLRSEEVQEIMGQVPPAILRWGITVILAIVVTALTLCCFIKYPENVSVQATLVNKSALIAGESNARYRCAVGQESLPYFHLQMPVRLLYGNYSCTGTVVRIQHQYDKNTGLYAIEVSCKVEKSHIPLLLQYQKQTAVNADISHKTIMRKILNL